MKLKNLRKTRRMTQVDVARAADIPRPLYALMEQGTLEPSAENYKALAGVFNVSVEYLERK